jgi:hypothetical protein
VRRAVHVITNFARFAGYPVRMTRTGAPGAESDLECCDQLMRESWL